MKTMKPRSIKELAHDPILKDMIIEWGHYIFEGETILVLAIPATKKNVWMCKHINVVIRNFTKIQLHYYINYTTHRTKIDIIRVMHKDLRKQLRKMYKYYPVEFGYALKSPCDMHDDEMAERVALERLIKKIKGAV